MNSPELRGDEISKELFIVGRKFHHQSVTVNQWTISILMLLLTILKHKITQ